MDVYKFSEDNIVYIQLILKKVDTKFLTDIS